MGNLFADLGTNRSTLLHHPGDWLGDHGVNILIILLGSWALRRLLVALLMGIFQRAFRRHQFEYEADRKKRLATLNSMIEAASKIIFWAIATMMVIGELGINTAPLLASAGVVGVAVGIGGQSVIKDFVNGLFIILENQYRVGDFVRLAPGTEGTVQAITIRTTVIKDMDGNVHHIPNSSITDATNMTFGTSGIQQDINISLATDVQKVEDIINNVGLQLAKDEKWGHKVKRAPYFYQIVNIGERGMVVKILGETAPGAQWDVATELLIRLRKEFIKHKIDVPMAPRALKADGSAAKTSHK